MPRSTRISETRKVTVSSETVAERTRPDGVFRFVCRSGGGQKLILRWFLWCFLKITFFAVPKKIKKKRCPTFRVGFLPHFGGHFDDFFEKKTLQKPTWISGASKEVVGTEKVDFWSHVDP